MTKFSDLALDPKVLQAVSEAGYETPTPIQVQAIPHALEGRDVLGIAQTGTGKTASFVLPMITHLSKGRARARMPRSLVLAPTRELAAQVAENFEKYSKHVKLSMALLIGGVSFKDQDKLIDRGVDVLIATPGRLLDHFERGKLMLTGVQIMVVDEADRMLDMGFIPDIERIFKMVPFTRQTLFFSATMAPEITRITQEFLHNPVRVEVARQATTSETIEQFVCKHTPKRRDSADGEKREVLRRLIRAEGEALTNGIIFCNRKRDVDVLAKSLRQHGFDASPLHGDLDQSLRTKILTSFREGELKLLIASDVAARGLDIPTVSHVFNFDVPIHSEDYVHRIGRTGRAGRTGKAITLCFPHEEKYLAKIEELVKKTIPLLPSPLAGAEPAPAPEAAEAAPAPRRSERPRRGEARPESRRDSAPREETRGDTRTPSAEAPRARGKDEARGGRRDRPVVGMGDHVPAFLLREFRFDTLTGAEERDEEPAGVEEAVVAPVLEAEAVEIAAVAQPVVEQPVVETVADEAPAAEAAAVDAPVAETPVEAVTAPTAEEAPVEAPAETVAAEAPEAVAAAEPVAAVEPDVGPAAEASPETAIETPGEAAPEAAAAEEAAPAKPKKPRAPRRRTPKAKAADLPAEETAPAA
ncbi:MAG: DEAD/DEAH box helicase [Rhodovulum sulfidophilum]|uniref:DEAD-box ATP-dependent RNA helicase RhpA n=1 Tax=Rhodovulum sulfidophilum TaxID=35806 RepID=A0A2W5NBE6_RHOSU|nr:MAG: DEAD/DEAH box helicase [Rhodovulum sulfidophilum]